MLYHPLFYLIFLHLIDDTLYICYILHIKQLHIIRY